MSGGAFIEELSANQSEGLRLEWQEPAASDKAIAVVNSWLSALNKQDDM
jgi:hypothetical protein